MCERAAFLAVSLSAFSHFNTLMLAHLLLLLLYSCIHLSENTCWPFRVSDIYLVLPLLRIGSGNYLPPYPLTQEYVAKHVLRPLAGVGNTGTSRRRGPCAPMRHIRLRAPKP